MAKERYLRSIRLLAQCYQTFTNISTVHLRTLNLTPPQFDIIATLGNTPGMCFRELGQKTLITKGTLTGIVDRLEEKGLVKRHMMQQDRRTTLVKLTPLGEQEFNRVFAPHIEHCKAPFRDYTPEQFEQIERTLEALLVDLESASSGEPGDDGSCPSERSGDL